MFFFVLLFSLFVLAGFRASAAGPDVTHPLSGLYTGYRYVLTREYDLEKPQPRERAELLILADGRFRFAALQRGKPGLWTRGKVLQDKYQTSENWDFLCDDLGGTLRCRVEKEALELTWQPSPLQVERFRFEPTAIMPSFEAGHPAVLGPAAPPIPTAPGESAFADGEPFKLFRGYLLSRSDLKQPPGRTSLGAALANTHGNILSGVSLLPASTPGQEPILVPFSAQVQESPERRSAGLVWSSPSPARLFVPTIISGPMFPETGVWAGETSLNGLVRGTFRFEPIGPSARSADPLPHPADQPAYYSLVAALEQPTSGFPFSPKLFFPAFFSTADSRLWVCSPDDPNFRLAFPMEHATDGTLGLNREGRVGHLIRLPKGEIGALVMRSIPSAHKAFRSQFIAPDHLWLALDLTIQTFSAPARTFRSRVILLLRSSEPG